MANEKHLRVLKPNPTDKITADDVMRWNAWRRENPGTEVDLRNANLFSESLEGINFSRVNLDGADLQGSGLRNAKLIKATLRGTKLRNADLLGADIECANVSDAHFHNAKFDQPYGMLDSVIGWSQCWGLPHEVTMIVLSMKIRYTHRSRSYRQDHTRAGVVVFILYLILLTDIWHLSSCM